MSFWKIFALACTAIIVDAISLQHQKRDLPTSICNTLFNTTNKVQCYCIKDKKEPPAVKSADCYLTVPNVPIDDPAWTTFKDLGNVERITLTNTRGHPLTYVPTEALKQTTSLLRLDIKYGNINTVGSYAFANLSSIEEITLRDNQIVILDPYSFIHHKDLKIISLDTNNIAEINRNVFVDLLSLEKLYLTNNQINTIHDRAFIHLVNLRELEIDRNKVFSLNFAVFEGLKKLEKLELSSNSLEVIGDNTFQALENLKSLNLEGNKIEMLDDKAFNGLRNLISLSLARNKLVYIDSNKVFEGLNSLLLLSLKGNKLKEITNTAIAPILPNFYGNSSSLDVEDNNFPCGCHLDWFVTLMNRTQNKHLKISIENLKCTPDDKLRDAWTKAQENEKSTTVAAEDDQLPQGQEADYEYYDDTQLNGTLFYFDIKDLLNCTTEVSTSTTSVKSTTEVGEGDRDPVTNAEKNTEINDNEIVKSEKNKRENNEEQRQETFTTSRLATVSAKPEESKIYENMASDEAKPDKGKAHRSIQDEPQSSKSIKDSHTNNANKDLGCAVLLVSILYLRLHI